MTEWTGTLTRADAIRILDHMTDQDDQAWESATMDYYDEDTDTLPTFSQVLAALGVSWEEYKAALAAAEPAGST